MLKKTIEMAHKEGSICYIFLNDGEDYHGIFEYVNMKTGELIFNFLRTIQRNHKNQKAIVMDDGNLVLLEEDEEEEQSEESVDYIIKKVGILIEDVQRVFLDATDDIPEQAFSSLSELRKKIYGKSLEVTFDHLEESEEEN